MAEPTLDASQDPGAPDPALHLKKRARRRLVGAIALALLGVIALPLVMDRQPPPVGPEIQVRIPSQEPVPTAGPAQNKPIGKPVAAPVADTSHKATAEAPPPASEVSKPIEAAASGPEKAETKPSPVKPEEPRAEKAKSVGDRARAEAALAGGSPAAPAKTDGDKWIVQLGAYQNAGNVNGLTGKLKEMRIPAYTEKFDSPQGPRTRVRAGPFASREAAAAAQERIKKILSVSGQLAPATADKPQ